MLCPNGIPYATRTLHAGVRPPKALRSRFSALPYPRRQTEAERCATIIKTRSRMCLKPIAAAETHSFDAGHRYRPTSMRSEFPGPVFRRAGASAVSQPARPRTSCFWADRHQSRHPGHKRFHLVFPAFEDNANGAGQCPDEIHGKAASEERQYLLPIFRLSMTVPARTRNRTVFRDYPPDSLISS